MKDLSSPTLVKIIFSVIAFIFIFLILYFVVKSIGYGGRWNCKLSYALAAPFGLFMDQNTAIQNSAMLIGATTVATITAVAGAYFLGKKLNIAGIETIARKILTNKYFIEGISMAGIGAIATYAFGSFVNSGISNLQEPIIKNLCKTNVVTINSLDWSFSDVESCIKDLEKEIKNNSKRKFILNTYKSLDERKLLCLAYKISGFIVQTYGETIGTNVKMPFAHAHYVIIIKENKQIQLSLADILAVLDMMDVNQNKTFYELLYQDSEANANPVGTIYYKYVISNLKSDTFSLSKDKGNVKIISFYYDSTNNFEKEDFIIYDFVSDNTVKYYMIIIKYTGLGKIMTITTKIT